MIISNSWIENDFIDDDVIIYTDGSYYNNWNDNAQIYEYGGIGVWIVYNKQEYVSRQPMDQQHILYCKQYVLAILPELLQRFHNNYSDLQFTNNQTTFENIMKRPKQVLYSNLLDKIRNSLNNTLYL